MSHTVVFAPEAETQLLDLYAYLALEASPDIATRYLDGVVAFCESLRTFPVRGVMRDDVRPGLRIMAIESGLLSLSR